MESARALKARIRSAENILQITRSMKMVSASKLRRAQTAMGRLQPMAEHSGRLLRQLAGQLEQTAEPLLRPREKPEKLCYVLLVGNRGLCGVYNSALLRFFQELLAGEERAYSVVVWGRWGQEQIEGAGIPVLRRFAQAGDVPGKEEAEELSAFLKELYLSGEADEVRLVYQRYVSFLKQEPGERQLLPVTAEAEEREPEQVIFEPDRETLLSALTELAVTNAVFSALLEARTGEHAARMAAMTSAVDNTRELIAKLSLALNHARQSAITTEISEIAGGAAAMENRR